MRRVRIVVLILLDALMVPLSGFISLWLRFEGALSGEQGTRFLGNLIWMLPVMTVVTIASFALFKLYRSLWEFASVAELMRIFWACAVSTALTIAVCTLLRRPLPRGVYIIFFMILLLLVGASRISFRVYRRFKYGIIWDVSPFSVFSRINRPSSSRVMLVGAGEAGSAAIREYSKPGGESVYLVCAVDDDPKKKNMLINGVRVMGNRYDIPKLVRELSITEIIVAIPAAQRRERAKILNICKTTGARLKLLPSTNELISGQVTVQRVRDVNIEDLLGRDEVRLDTASISGYLEGKTVLVTGGGGSIGSELCRQAARFRPKKLIVLDIYENNMYLLQQELRSVKGLDFLPLIGSVRDEERLDQVFSQFKPDIVFHAAAHKHVPLVENSPSESVKNNIFGTYQTAKAAAKHGVSRFVMISTDKAVNPTNVMGATKRVAEMIIQGMNTLGTATEFVAVRFGNVLGSDGSIIPLIRAQIARGGPVTLTHPEITRYFMTIPEAAGLVLQAGALAEGGEIFILDMGQPVRIADLIYDLIRLSGLEPDEDIKIVVSGLRPGEKLYEELLTAEEGLRATKHEKIFVGRPSVIDMPELERRLENLRAAAEAGDNEKTRSLLRECVPTYKPETNR